MKHYIEVPSIDVIKDGKTISSIECTCISKAMVAFESMQELSNKLNADIMIISNKGIVKCTTMNLYALFNKVITLLN